MIDIGQRTYDITLIGRMPLFMHLDDVEQADGVDAWRKAPANKKTAKGDDRCPAWTWQTYLYHDGEHLAFPQANIMVALRTAGAMISSGGRSTFKKLTQTGIFAASDYFEFRTNGEQIALKDILKFKDEPFSIHKHRVEELGFELSVKRAKPTANAKHVRVRPLFLNWEIRGTLLVLEKDISTAVLDQMLELAGRLAGLGDWRPSAPKSPGPYGTFAHKLVEVEVDKRRRKAS